MSQSDGELLARLSRGDRAAFDEVFRTWYPRLVRVAEGLVRDEAVAEELVQDVLLELWRRREQLAADGAVHAYLLRATRNRALNHLRHQQVARRGAVHVATDEARPAAATAMLEAQELDAAVRRAMDALPPRCREVFELNRVHGLRYAQIADTLGVSVKAVEAQMGRALRTMRDQLREWLPEARRETWDVGRGTWVVGREEVLVPCHMSRVRLTSSSAALAAAAACRCAWCRSR